MSLERLSYPTLTSQVSVSHETTDHVTGLRWNPRLPPCPSVNMTGRRETTHSTSQVGTGMHFVVRPCRGAHVSSFEYAGIFTSAELLMGSSALGATKLGLPKEYYLLNEPECIASSFVGDTFGFLATVYALDADNDRAKQIKIIYRRLGDALHSEQFHFVERVFEDIDVWRVHISASLSILTATLRWKGELKRRSYFYNSVSSRIKADSNYRNHHEAYLRGLS